MRARNPMANVRTTPVILMLSLRDNIILRRVVTIFYGVLSTLGVVNPDLGRMWYERRNAF